MKKSYLYAGVTVLIWSTLATVVKLVLQDIPNLQALTISSAFAFVFLLILNIINGSIKEMKCNESSGRKQNRSEFLMDKTEWV